MDPLLSETCWNTFKYFIILMISMNYIFVHLLDNKVFNCTCEIYHFTQKIVLTLKLCVFTNARRQQTSSRHGLPIAAVENFRYMW